MNGWDTSCIDFLATLNVFDEEMSYAISTAHHFLDERYSRQTFDFCIEHYEEQLPSPKGLAPLMRRRSALELAVQLATWMMHPMLDVITRRAREESFHIERLRADALRAGFQRMPTGFDRELISRVMNATWPQEPR
jgi:hypothetical protein